MERFNTSILGLTVTILDTLYRGRDTKRFWVLEVIARAPYFAFLSVLHFKESLGLRTESHYNLMKEHFEQTVNETEHLREMEQRGGDRAWIDRFLAYHLVLVYYWTMVAYYFVAPRSAYHLNSEVELHATLTYAKYLTTHKEDTRIWEIMNDEVQHWQEMNNALRTLGNE